MSKHTLNAVMSLPVTLFQGVANTITCIMLFTANIPHDKEIPTYLGTWKDDGYIWRKGTGRIPDGNRPNEIRELWLKSYKRNIDNADLGIWQCLDGEDECCWERYVKTDYSKITQEDFEKEVKDYALFKLRQYQICDLESSQLGD